MDGRLMKEVDVSLIWCGDGRGGRGIGSKVYLERSAQYGMRDTR